MQQDWVIIRAYQDANWAEHDALKLNSIGIESRIEEIPEEDQSLEMQGEGWVQLVVKEADAEEAAQLLADELEALMTGDTPGARKMLLGGIACMVGLIVAFSPLGGPVESLAWFTMGIGAFEFMRGVYQQREEENDLLAEDKDAGQTYEGEEPLDI